MEKDKKLTLNVGGKYFMTYQSTLLKYPDTLLGRMYSNDSCFKVDEVQFFDRSSKLFEYILNFYRTGMICKPLLINKDMWQEELRYWGLPQDTTSDIWESLSEVLNMIRDGKINRTDGTDRNAGPMGARGPVGSFIPSIK